MTTNKDACTLTSLGDYMTFDSRNENSSHLELALEESLLHTERLLCSECNWTGHLDERGYRFLGENGCPRCGGEDLISLENAEDWL